MTSAVSARTVLRWLRSESGAVGVLSAVAAPMLLVFVGLAIDYTRASTAKRSLQAAADVATLALSAGQLNDAPLTTADARRLAEENAIDLSDLQITDVSVAQDASGDATVVISADISTFFLGLAGHPTLSMSVVAAASYDNPPDLDIFVLLDNSPSMLLGATPADMASIGVINQGMGEGNCAFACHYPGRDSYTAAQIAGHTTRLDAAKNALGSALDIAIASDLNTYADIYFKVDTFTAGYQSVSDGEASALKASGEIAAIQPIDSYASGFKYTQSDQEAALATATTELTARRAAHTDRQAFFLLITDGVIDAKKPNRVIDHVDPAWCDAIKAQGVKLGVIYTTYFEIPSNGFWVSNVQPFTDDIGPSLESCASPGWFFEAQYEEDINDAIEQLMALALPKPRLVQ